MVDWHRIFEEAAWEIHGRVKPIFGSEEGGKVLGRGAGGDLSRMIDVLAEEIVIKTLESRGVSCVLVSEECGVKSIGGGKEGSYVVLDGIDGTTNAVHGLPFASTSLAFADGPRLKDVKIGLVMDFSRDIVFHAEKGRGSFQGGVRLKPSSVTEFREALASFELSFPGNRGERIQSLIPLLASSRKIRILGSTALELCYVASGSLDAFIDVRNVVRATDLAAAHLILEEAGGSSVTPEGQPLDMELKASSRTSFIAASNPSLYVDILKILRVEQKNY